MTRSAFPSYAEFVRPVRGVALLRVDEGEEAGEEVVLVPRGGELDVVEEEAAALVVDGSTRQELLATPDAVSRLRLGTRILSSESALISAFGAIPALDLLNATPSEN